MTKECEKVLFLKHQESYLFCWLQCSPVCRLRNQSPPLSLLLAADIWFRLKHTAAMQGLFKLDLSIYWHSRWTSSSDCFASAMGSTLLQWFMWTHVALSATFTAVCVTRSTWKGSSHLFDFQLFLLWSRITTKSPGLTSCRNLSATFPWAAFTCTEIFDNRQDISLQ